MSRIVIISSSGASHNRGEYLPERAGDEPTLLIEGATVEHVADTCSGDMSHPGKMRVVAHLPGLDIRILDDHEAMADGGMPLVSGPAASGCTSLNACAGKYPSRSTEKRTSSRVSGDAAAPPSFVLNAMPGSCASLVQPMLEKLVGPDGAARIVSTEARDIETDLYRPNCSAIIGLARDMRDIVVAEFHRAANEDIQRGYRQARYRTVEQFYYESFLGRIRSSEKFYMGDLERWVDTLGANCIPIIKYEDIVADTAAALETVSIVWRVDARKSDLMRIALTHNPIYVREGRAIVEGCTGSTPQEERWWAGMATSWRRHLPARVADDITRRFEGYQARLGYAGRPDPFGSLCAAADNPA